MAGIVPFSVSDKGTHSLETRPSTLNLGQAAFQCGKEWGHDIGSPGLCSALPVPRDYLTSGRTLITCVVLVVSSSALIRPSSMKRASDVGSKYSAKRIK